MGTREMAQQLKVFVALTEGPEFDLQYPCQEALKYL